MTQYPTKRDREVKFKRFQASLKDIDRRNAAEKAKNGTAVFGISVMSDLSPDEFETKYLCIMVLDDTDSEFMLADTVEAEAFRGESHSVDWTGILTTPVNDEISCCTSW